MAEDSGGHGARRAGQRHARRRTTGETLTVTAVTQPANGTVTFTGANVSFTPAANFFGTTTFTYTHLGRQRRHGHGDGDGDGDRGERPADGQRRQRHGGRGQRRHASSTCWPTTPTAPDTGETLTVTAVTQPANGTVTFTGTAACSFTPAPDFFGTTTFTYTVSDGNGGTATATVTVTVTPVNDRPTADERHAHGGRGQRATALDVLANDTHRAGRGRDADDHRGDAAGQRHGDASPAPACSFTPAANFIGTTTFTYTISDGNGGTATATVTVTVTPVNDPPDGQRRHVTVAEDSGATASTCWPTTRSAPDAGETLTITAVTQPANGTVTLHGRQRQLHAGRQLQRHRRRSRTRSRTATAARRRPRSR